MNTFFTHFKKFTFFFALVIGSLVLTQCEAPIDSTDSGETGRLIVKLTDDPFPADLVEEANITINKIEIRRAEEEGDGEKEDAFTTIFSGSETFNLLELTNEVTTTLVDLEIEAGSYDHIRLHISDASIKLKDEEEPRSLKVPSGAHSGLKIFIEPSIVVQGGLTQELLLDVDVSRSFVVQGNRNTPAGIKGFIFKPVVRATNMSTAGTISGTVSDGNGDPVGDAEVWITKEGEKVTMTLSDSDDGSYALIGVEEGVYDLHATKDGFDEALVEDVTVTAANRTTEDLTINEL